MPRRRVLAAFDFDDTLIRRDSLPDFLLRCGPNVALKILRCGPTLILFALGRISNAEAKQRVLERFIRDMPEAQWEQRCAAYAIRLEQLTNAAALGRVKWHQERGDEIVIVSAGIEDWIRPWAKRHGITQVLATRLERRDGRLTGRLDGPNCYGPEKAVRLLAQYPKRDTYELYAYGDGASDRQLFELADRVFKRRFE